MLFGYNRHIEEKSMSLNIPLKRVIEGVGLGVTVVIGYFYIPKNTFEFMALILAFFVGAMLAESYFRNIDANARIIIDLSCLFLGHLVGGLSYAVLFTAAVAISGVVFWALIAVCYKIAQDLCYINKKTDFTEFRK